MKTFGYFVIYSKDGIMKLMPDTFLTEDDVLTVSAMYPDCKNMGVEQKFLFLLNSWNNDQTHPTIRYFYGPIG